MDTIWPDTLATEAGPKYKAVAQIIRAAVAEGTLTQGTRLPPVRDLAWQLKITPGTVARAYTILTDEGLLNAEVGRGTFVAPPVDDDALFAPPIEVDSAAHNREAQDWRVNMVSPHLPSVGQAQLIRNLLADIARDPPSGMMHYPDRTNARPAREAVVKWLAGAQLGHMDQGDVVLANGGQSAIVLLMQALLKGRKPVVLVEELSYPGFRRAADLVRADVVPVAMDAHGVIPEALARAAAQHDAQIFCTSPEVHNPTCLFTPLQRRLELVEVARAHDLQIIDDDCYQIAAAKAPSYRKLAPERGWYVSSISKSLTPALRVGMAIAPHGRAAPLRRAAEHAFFGLPTPILDLTAALLTHPQLPALTAQVQAGINQYVQAAVNILGRYDLRWSENVPFVWLPLPEGWRATAFCQAAEAQGVQVRAGEEFACRDARSPHAVRFAINAGVRLETFRDAAGRLRMLLDNPPEQINV
ncbi:DNA-binding transcriptional regulator, MocR family, contains an aminotransferase domain [Pseudosulfitobacter pseudonitzschiae]|uniref:Aspartate aminotransferase n=1 Tax=Pseudosulfitobacter pseudonitzschiae TaxID=1402135 RepID=A0A073IYG8_9RHOB|nr:PLP-dependent aminotransferase family protein [Pseudosulfitobacter pseudonitzschiae]KEJ94784.1 aspartate aminotransferase [Pseudosulfitobacter pseudonitzschiae]QKS08618.1 PLP-dependent aminotransferase family protein [Pseudosulfitobacter pseudonitzschiae]SHF80408.1 DNA-binding transcriptional regulator, MocR family, contains an aminotransferase domain [Pseudosulfitobacter pseudonitzschiae]